MDFLLIIFNFFFSPHFYRKKASRDFDKYRKSYELEDHWQLKKAFMERYVDDYPEDELLKLAQLCVNVETLGVGYGREVMEKVRKLQEDVPYIAEWRESKSKLDLDRSKKKKDMKKRRHEGRDEGRNQGFNNSPNQAYGYRRPGNQDYRIQQDYRTQQGYQIRQGFQNPQNYQNRQGYQNQQAGYQQANQYGYQNQHGHQNQYGNHYQHRQGFQNQPRFQNQQGYRNQNNSNNNPGGYGYRRPRDDQRPSGQRNYNYR